MKKTWKRVLSVALALVVSLGALTFAPAVAKADTTEYDMFLAIGANNDWAYQFYGEGAEGNTGDVTGTVAKAKIGEAVTIGVTFPAAADYTWFCAPVLVAEGVTDVQFTLNSVKIDGNDILSTINLDARADGRWWYEATGAYTDTQAVRLAGGYNEWGDKFIAESPTNYTTIEYNLTLDSVTIGGEAAGGEEAPAETGAAFDPAGTYNAYLGVQTPSWSFRNAWDDAEYGKASDVFNQITGWDAENNAEVRQGTITDAVVAGNGTYKVSLTDIGDWAQTEVGQSTDGTFNLLFISTDIPLSEDIKITDVKLLIDGKVVHTDAEAFLDPDVTDYVKILIQNIWNPDKAQISFYNAPTSSLEMEFTISGFSYDNESAAEPEAPAETEAAPSTEATAPSTEAGTTEAGGINPIVIIVVVVAVAAVAVGAVFMMKKKK